MTDVPEIFVREKALQDRVGIVSPVGESINRRVRDHTRGNYMEISWRFQKKQTIALKFVIVLLSSIFFHSREKYWKSLDRAHFLECLD